MQKSSPLYRRAAPYAVLALATLIGASTIAYKRNSPNTPATPVPLTLENITEEDPTQVALSVIEPLGKNATTYSKLHEHQHAWAEQAKDVTVTFNQKVALLPNTPYFQNLEKKLNQELLALQEILPEQLRFSHRVVLATTQTVQDNFPPVTNATANIYLLNNAKRFYAYAGKIGQDLSFAQIEEDSLGESTIEMLPKIVDGQVVVEGTRMLTFAHPEFRSPPSDRYSGLLNTALAEYLHSCLAKTKVAHVGSILRARKKATGTFNAQDALKAFSTTNVIEEGIVHASVLTYLSSRGTSVEFISQLLAKYAKENTYHLVTPYFDSLKENKLPLPSSVAIPLRAYQEGAPELDKGKNGLTAYIKRTASNNKSEQQTGEK